MGAYRLGARTLIDAGLAHARGSCALPAPGPRTTLALADDGWVSVEGEIGADALAHALAFAANLVLCILLVPKFGGHGAAAATSIALVFETVLLFWIVRRRLGLHVLAFGKRS